MVYFTEATFLSGSLGGLCKKIIQVKKKKNTLKTTETCCGTLINASFPQTFVSDGREWLIDRGLVDNIKYQVLFTQPLRSGRIWHKVNF